MTNFLAKSASITTDQFLEYFLLACVCMCVYFLPPRLLLTEKKNDKCNARDQINDDVLRKLFCVKSLCRHVIDNHSRDIQASNYARVSVKPGRATRSKKQLLILSTNQRLKRKA